MLNSSERPLVNPGWGGKKIHAIEGEFSMSNLWKKLFFHGREYSAPGGGLGGWGVGVVGGGGWVGGGLSHANPSVRRGRTTDKRPGLDTTSNEKIRSQCAGKRPVPENS